MARPAAAVAVRAGVAVRRTLMAAVALGCAVCSSGSVAEAPCGVGWRHFIVFKVHADTLFFPKVLPAAVGARGIAGVAARVARVAGYDA